jgi:hypothetical protein
MSLLSRLAVQAARAYGMLVGGASTNVPASYLVVAAGAGGGVNTGGGGGAGGYLTSSFTLSTLNTYSITVGAGGAGGTSGSVKGTNGSDSSVSGTGLTTVTSTGGGGGGSRLLVNGSSGGSGGGGAGNNDVALPHSGGSGTSGQGFAGGNGNDTSPAYGAAGGGGSSSVGSNGTSSAGGAGGSGTASSISGSSVTYAGGGGGGAYGTSTGGAGGSGGGGGGGGSGVLGTAGTANTGGGGGGTGGGSNAANTNGSGGSGIVIISYTSATPKFVGGTLTTSGGNQIHTFTSSGTLSPLTPVTASYLVVAGGGGGAGASNGGGAGGAGGLLTSSTTIYSGATYVVTVGAGGAGGTSGTNGSDSVLLGTGITTVTSIGGGRANNNANGSSGGSGGGASSTNGTVYTGGAGTSGQGFAGGNSVSTSPFATGGGGGASAVGANGSGSQSGNGGAGTASSISGTSITYAGGGGGGGTAQGSTRGTGGAGGGGDGGASGSSGVSGTPNLGGGGGGGSNSGGVVGGAGGSGVVIISYAGSQVFNGGLVTSSGGNTIHTFTSTGALTPLTNNLTNSLRFRASNSNYLNRTFVTPTDNKKWTYSGWVKRGTLGSASQQHFFNYWTGGTGQAGILFSATTDTIEFFDYTGSYGYQLVTTQVFRDPSAWYHFVIAVDTTQATAANRIKMYVNGNQITAFGTSTYPSLNYNTLINSANAHYIGRRGDASGYFDGYQTDINFIDGQALEPYYFGNNDANGVWKPILYKGTYGTNGFYLTFGNTTSTTTLGYDSSPNGNNWTTNNISLTAGVTYDAMTDVPTNTSATVANYPTLNPLSNTSTLTEANLSASNILQAGTTMATPTTGKWYFEYTQTTSIPSGSLWVGVASNTSAIADNQLQGYAYASDGRKVAYNSYTSGYGATWTNGDVIGCALDLDNQTITFYKNNTSQGTAFTSITAQPYVFALSAGGAASTKGGSINCGQRPFTYTPPTGFVALNTFNLPTPTILQGNKYMDANLWTGNGSSPRVFNGWNFRPDFIWIKARNTTHEHALIDSNRGTGSKVLNSNSTAAEWGAGLIVSSFDSNGFTGTTGSVNFTWANSNNDTYVGWGWNAGSGTNTTNTAGTITTTTSVNTTAGFSVFTFTGTGASSASIGHGLGIAPKFMIFKQRNGVASWNVLTNAAGSNQYGFLDLTTAFAAAGETWTSTVINIGANFTNGSTYVCYAWAEIAGFSKFGSYTGNGSADGVFVYTGFRPKWILIKNASNGVQGWTIQDTSRSTYNVVDNYLLAQASSAEQTIYAKMDYLSNGFKVRTSDALVNGSGNTIIYAAFAENPFKNANAR